MRDVTDWVSMCVGFDAGVAFVPAGVKIAVFPRLRFDSEGLVHVSVGGKAPLYVSNFKYGDQSAHISARLGKRFQDLVWEEEPESTKNCSHVSREMLEAALESFIGESLQTPLPNELNQRSYITELNFPLIRKGPSLERFYEGPQQRKIVVKSFSNFVFNEKDNSFSFDIDFTGFIDLHRLIDDLGMKMNTFATVEKLVSTKYMGITAENALKRYQLSLNEVRRSISKNENSYKRIVAEMNLKGRDISTKFNSPFQMVC